MAELIGGVLDDKYRVEGLLGQGGMGAVYRATHLGTKRPVALKIIAPQFMKHEEFIARFKREAEAAGRLLHPNIVNVTDFGFAYIKEEQVAYLVMEYLDGGTLGGMLKRYSYLPLRAVVDIIEQICLAISVAHRQGVIHRDLKPDNIWLQPDGRGGYVVKVLDFGLAKLRYAPLPGKLSAPVLESASASHPLLDKEEVNRSAVSALITPSRVDLDSPKQIRPANVSDDTPTAILPLKKESADRISTDELTQVGSILGTPLYMSPEQCNGEPLDTRSDIYSLGIIVYQMLAGEPPFIGDTQQLIAQHCSAPIPSLAEKRPDIPKAVALLVESSLAKSPAQRPADVASFASALRANSDGAGMLVHQALTLYSEHFWKFVKISLMAYIPFFIIIVLHLMNEVQTIIPLLPSAIGENAAYLLRLLMVLSGQIAFTINSGIFVPIIAQLQIAPLRPLLFSTVFMEFKKRFRAFVVTSVLFNLITSPMLTLFGMLIYRVWLHPARMFLLLALLTLLAIAGIKLTLDYSLYSSVVILEELQGMAALRRAKALASRTRRTLITIFLPFVLIAINNLFVFLGVLAGSEVKSNILIGNRIISSNLHVYDSALAAFITLVGIVANPPFAIILAMLYLKARQAGGDTLKAILVKFEQDEENRKSKTEEEFRAT